MEDFDAEIRRQAEQLQHQQLARLDQETAARQSIEAADRQENAMRQERQLVIPQLCGRFAVWASGNGIPYNSPSLFAPGWLLGRGDGPPTYSYSHQGISGGGSSTYSLLVRSSGAVSELVTNNVWRKRMKHHLFPRPAHFDRYTVESVQASIAAFSAAAHKPWS